MVFEEMTVKDTCSWNALINGYGVNRCANEALEVFAVMLHEEFEANETTMTSVLSACNHCGIYGRRTKMFFKLKQWRGSELCPRLSIMP